MTSQRDETMVSGEEPRRAAVRAQVAPLSEHELRILVDQMARFDLSPTTPVTPDGAAGSG